MEEGVGQEIPALQEVVPVETQKLPESRDRPFMVAGVVERLRTLVEDGVIPGPLQADPLAIGLEDRPQLEQALTDLHLDGGLDEIAGLQGLADLRGDFQIGRLDALRPVPGAQDHQRQDFGRQRALRRPRHP